MSETTTIVFDKQCALYCRRQKMRDKLKPARVTCWSAATQPRAVTVVEADARGARLVLPFTVHVGETVRVCFADEMNLHQTRRARVVGATGWNAPIAPWWV